MFLFNLKSSIILLAIGFVAGFGTTFLFKGCDNHSTLPHTNIVSTQDLKKQAATLEDTYQQQITELAKRNYRLQAKLKSAREELSQAKSKVRQRESRIKKIIDSNNGLPAKELLARAKPEIPPDSVSIPCDSLADEVSEYIRENHLKDSLYESQAVMQDSIIEAKDSVITLKTEQYKGLQILFDESLQQQENLLKENKSLRKQFKRQRFKNTLKTIGLIIFSGTVTNYIMNH